MHFKLIELYYSHHIKSISNLHMFNLDGAFVPIWGQPFFSDSINNYEPMKGY